MLILSRRCGQSIMIGDEVEVFVIDIGDDKVRLGVTGPGCVPIHKRERYPHPLQEPSELAVSHHLSNSSSRICVS